MAGHSKWKQIKRKKAVTDARRGAAFTKLIREITIAARQGGGDPAGNARLRTAIEAAKAENMPWDNIDRAIKKGAGGLDGVQYEEVTYEGYGPGGAAILIQATTDNANRTVAEIRHLFTRYGGNLGAANSVAWMFDRKAQIVTGPASQLHSIQERLKGRGLAVQSAEIAMTPKSTVKVEGTDAKRLLELIEGLEEMDDVA